MNAANNQPVTICGPNPPVLPTPPECMPRIYLNTLLCKFLFFVALTLSQIGLVESSENKILDCEGTVNMTSVPPFTKLSTRDAKRLAHYDKRGHQTFEIEGDKLIVRQQPTDIAWRLCTKTASEYVFASSCRTNVVEYEQDWIAEKNHIMDKKESPFFPSPFFRKYKYMRDQGSLGSLEIISIDRVSLTLHAVNYDAMWDLDEGSPSHGRMLKQILDFNCRVLRPKI